MTTRSIGDVAQHLGLVPDTLRYYERRGVVPNPGRDAGGRRAYTEADVHLLEVLLHLRATGMPLADIASFTHYVSQDPAGVAERLNLLLTHRDHVLAEQDRVTRALAVIDQKIKDYRSRL
ncbi:MerR family transcriptional regulator [Janibacter indicus]|uniref:DNA-binding transcriptional regulator, MerR family n=1 Tax=Janibacter indicus TaxID=857417 RepID=A0A1W2A7R6_9MICO|nr:MerR family transcriptional regulator [Janibacter indicus]SMC56461.1 DNA-binding transcriptional regulator, MerR family [Janibacter indicus]